MKVRAIIFTYEGDRDLLKASANRLIDAGVEVTCAWDKTCPQFARDQIPRANHIITRFERKKNLNGKPCLLAMYALFRELSIDADWVIKCDSDVVVRNAFLRRLAASTNVAEGVRYETTGDQTWWGAAYAIKGSFMPAMDDAANKAIIIGGVPEDATTGELLRHMEAPYSTQQASWVHYGPAMMVTVPGADVRHFGDMRNIPAPAFSVLQRKKYIAQQMTDFIEKDPDCQGAAI